MGFNSKTTHPFKGVSDLQMAMQVESDTNQPGSVVFPEKHVKLTIVRYFAYLMLLVTIFSGRFSLGRLAEVLVLPDWLEVRTISLALAIFMILLGRHYHYFKLRQISASEIFFILALGIFYVYSIINISVWGAQEIRGIFIYDTLTIFITLLLILAIIGNKNDLIGLLFCAEMLGLGLFILAAAGVGNPDLNGHAWAPVGGPITFYRIEFFAFCAALYLAWESEKWSTRIAHSVISWACLFATLASLSKAAILGVIIGAFVLLFHSVIVSRYRRLLVLVVILVLVAVPYYYFMGSLMEGRIQAGLGSNSRTMLSMSDQRESVINYRTSEHNENEDIRGIPENIHASSQNMLLSRLLLKYSINVDLDEFTDEEKERLRALWVIFRDYGAPDYRKNTPGFIRWVNQNIVVSDRSSRLGMVQVAMDALKNNKWYGEGIGNYRFLSLDTAGKDFEVYRYPHNIILEIAGSSGLLGLGLFGIAFLAGFVIVLKKAITDSLVPFLIVYLIFISVTALFSGDLYDFRVFWMTLLVISVPVLKNSERKRHRALV